MDVTAFFTTGSLIERKDTTVNAPAGAKNALPGQNFLDFILAQISETQGADDKAAQIFSDDNAALNSDLDFASTIAANDEIRAELKAWMLDPSNKLSQALALNQEALDAALGAVNDGIITSANIQAGSPQILKALLLDTEADASGAVSLSSALEKLQAILGKLEALMKNSKDGGLMLTNLTPEEITDLRAKVEALMNQEVNDAMTEEQKRKALDGIYLGLIKIIAPPEQTKVATIQAAVTKIEGDEASQVNNLSKPAPGAKGTKREEWIDEGVEDGTETNKFGDMLKDFAGGKKNALNIDMAVKTPGVKADMATLQGWPFNVEGSIFAPVSWSQVPYETIGGASPALSITSLGSLTNLITQAHSASQPHPAMQQVAATISKAAASGETKNIILQLDPPELGRVEVRLNFGKDKSVKAILTAEKPETLGMLQRDAHALERILTDSGFNVDSGGIDFGLAGEGQNFNQDGQDGSNGYASKDDGVQEIIESKMTWSVDPDTGHMRYSILA